MHSIIDIRECHSVGRAEAWAWSCVARATRARALDLAKLRCGNDVSLREAADADIRSVETCSAGSVASEAIHDNCHSCAHLRRFFGPIICPQKPSRIDDTEQQDQQER